MALIEKLCHIGYDESNFNFRNYVLFRFFSRKKIFYWPKSKTCAYKHPENFRIGKNSVIFKNGCYIQGVGELIVGDYVQFATNIGVITANHDVNNQSAHIKGRVEIGDFCWIGMNSIILPNVTLGPRTVVGAGSVVTKSFPEGFCVIAGNPARKIKNLDPALFVKPQFQYEAYGWILADEFEKFQKKHLILK